MNKFTIKGIISRADVPTRRMLIRKEAIFLSSILGIWLGILLIDVAIFNLAGYSFVTHLFVNSSGSILPTSRRSGGIIALLIILGPPCYVGFRLLFARAYHARRVALHLWEQGKITAAEHFAISKFITRRIAIISLVVLSIILISIITFAIMR